MTLAELADAADVTPRTVRYYIAQGLLPPPVGAGSAACYTDAHLRHLKAIKALQQQHLPLSEIRGRLDREPAPDLAAGSNDRPPSSALDYLNQVLGGSHKPPIAALPPVQSGSPAASSSGRSTWDRHQLVADVEIHVRRPLPRDVQRKLDRLLDYARHLFEEVP